MLQLPSGLSPFAGLCVCDTAKIKYSEYIRLTCTDDSVFIYLFIFANKEAFYEYVIDMLYVEPVRGARPQPSPLLPQYVDVRCVVPPLPPPPPPPLHLIVRTNKNCQHKVICTLSTTATQFIERFMVFLTR